MIYTFADFERILEESRQRVGRHDGAIAALRFGERMPKVIRKTINSVVKRTADLSKPYFEFEAAGLKFMGDRRDRYAVGIARMPSYEDATVGHILESLATHPGAYLDIGTNMGVVAALVASQTDQMVVAVEPDPETARRAACAFAMNGLRNVTLFNGAVGEADGELEFFHVPGSSDAATLSAATSGSGAVAIKVPVRSVDSLVESLGIEKVGFLKIDVEGFEPQAVRGAEQTIRNHHPDLFYEYHWEIAPKLGWTAEDVRAILEGFNTYDYSVLHEDDPVYPFPPTPEMGLAVNVWCRSA